MIVDCPNCRKQISSAAPMCPHCGFARGEVSDEQLVEFTRRRLRDRIYRLKMASYAIMTLFLAAFGWYWWETSGFLTPSGRGPVVLLAVGTTGYVAIRILLAITKRELRKSS